jgi:hypothetical protein
MQVLSDEAGGIAECSLTKECGWVLAVVLCLRQNPPFFHFLHLTPKSAGSAGVLGDLADVIAGIVSLPAGASE